jgi:hypothetical protein
MSTLLIHSSDNEAAAIAKMADKNFGSWDTMCKIVTKGPLIDPETVGQPMAPIHALDAMGIRGKDIYVLYNDICYGDLPKTLAVIKAAQNGMLPVEILKEASSREDCSGRDMVPVFKIYDRILNQFPNFNNK